MKDEKNNNLLGEKFLLVVLNYTTTYLPNITLL